MAQRAVAERNRESVIIASTAEVEASRNVAKAALTLNAVPGALRLRELQTIKDISSEKNEKVIIFMPNNTGTEGSKHVEIDEAYIANMYTLIDALGSDVSGKRKSRTIKKSDLATKAGADFTRGGADFTLDTNIKY
jgi:hypothetical protein